MILKILRKGQITGQFEMQLTVPPGSSYRGFTLSEVEGRGASETPRLALQPIRLRNARQGGVCLCMRSLALPPHHRLNYTFDLRAFHFTRIHL
jgi:hypothetical protein